MHVGDWMFNTDAHNYKLMMFTLTRDTQSHVYYYMVYIIDCCEVYKVCACMLDFTCLIKYKTCLVA